MSYEKAIDRAVDALFACSRRFEQLEQKNMALFAREEANALNTSKKEIV